jgi:hypothetical protein
MHLSNLALARVQAQLCELPHESVNPTVLQVSIMTGIVCFVMVALRLVARHYTGNKLWLDDLFQILGAVSSIDISRSSTTGMAHSLITWIFSRSIDFYGSPTGIRNYG